MLLYRDDPQIGFDQSDAMRLIGFATFVGHRKQEARWATNNHFGIGEFFYRFRRTRELKDINWNILKMVIEVVGVDGWSPVIDTHHDFESLLPEPLGETSCSTEEVH